MAQKLTLGGVSLNEPVVTSVLNEYLAGSDIEGHRLLLDSGEMSADEALQAARGLGAQPPLEDSRSSLFQEGCAGTHRRFAHLGNLVG